MLKNQDKHAKAYPSENLTFAKSPKLFIESHLTFGQVGQVPQVF